MAVSAIGATNLKTTMTNGSTCPHHDEPFVAIDELVG